MKLATVAMGLSYVKRYRMEVALSRFRPRLRDRTVPGYRLVGWRADLVDVHAETKYLSFRSEIDADVFPCLGERGGCQRLMDEIRRKEGFLPEATWLVEYFGDDGLPPGFCGTVQGIRVDGGYGGIQNLGVVPEHRGRGMGRLLLEQALEGFRQAGLARAYLEVTAQNAAAIRLYQSLGFSKTRTLYKAIEVALR